MNAEIIAVGSELLLGQIVNTNARFISEKLALLGVNVFYHTVVGDNSTRLVQALEVAETRSDLVIVTGGLGPTKDDLTKEAIADHLKLNLVSDQEALTAIEEFFVRSGREMTENNKKQALILEGSTVFPNLNGMAPGMAISRNGRTYILLPGPPSEMEPMFAQFGTSYLLTIQEDQSSIVSRVLRFFGIGEAALETEIVDLLDNQTNPTIAPLASDGEVTLRITAKTSNRREALSLIDQAERQILDRVGEFFYGYDDTSLLEECYAKLQEKDMTIAAAESLTGGLFQQELTSLQGVSAIFKGGIVTYSNQAKEKILGVKASTIDTYGVVSVQCAIEMASCVREKFDTDIGVSFTGVAGPSELEGKPVGTVYLGFAFRDGTTKVKELHLGNRRSSNRIRSMKHACYFLLKELN